MLRKHNKLIMLLILVTFMFTMVGSAGAATFSDVSGTSTQTAAIYRLNSLGIIDGYPDGTFGPDKTITRAEFAKIACVTAGLKSVASGMGSTASPFSDVATDYWANGWINVAAAQGFVKGDPAGTFRPEANITQAEAITVLMRLLGYNDNLAGNWPSDYIAKAANLGDLDDVTFVADQAATRGIIATLTDAVLDENVVVYKASDNIFENETSGNTLLQDNFTSTTTADPVMIYDLDLSGGDRAIKVVDPTLTDAAKIKTAIDKNDFVSYKLTDDCVISGATSILGVAGRYAEYTLNDDGDVSYIKVRNDSDYTVVTGLDPSKIKRTGTNTFKLDNGKSYTLAANFDTYSSSFPGSIRTTSGYTAGSISYERKAGTGFLGTSTADITSSVTHASMIGATDQYLDKYLENADLLVTEDVDLILDKDGNVAYVNFNCWPTVAPPTLDVINVVGIVDSVNTKTGKVSLKGQGSYTLDADDAGNQVIIRNGAVAKLADLAANDMVWFCNKYSTDLVVAMSATATGTLESYETTTFLGNTFVKNVVVGDKTYNVIKCGGYVSTDDGDTYAEIGCTSSTSDLDDYLGGDATVYLSPTGRVAAILAGTGTGTSGSIYGVINDDTVQALVNSKVTDSIEIQLPDGTYATYSPDSDTETYIDGSKSTFAALTKDQFVQITLNSDGYIDKVKAGANVDPTKAGVNSAKAYYDLGDNDITGDKDEMTITIDGNSYDASNMVVFNTSLNSKSYHGTDDNEVDTVDLTQFMKDVDGSTGILANGSDVYAQIVDGAIKYLVIDNDLELGSNNNMAIVTGTGFNSDGAYVKLMTTGAPVQYTIKGEPAGAYAKGNVVNYSLSSGDVKINSMEEGWNVASAPSDKNLTITKISGNIITIYDSIADETTSYAVNSDTLYFDFTKTDPVVAAKGDFAVDDQVLVYQQGSTDAISAIVLLK